MIVFIYFFEKMHLLRDLINGKEMELKVCIIVIYTHTIFLCVWELKGRPKPARSATGPSG